MTKFYAWTLNNKITQVYRMRVEDRIHYPERWTPDGWIDCPPLMSVLGMGGGDPFDIITEQDAKAFIESQKN